jgi:hypothetical protein
LSWSLKYDRPELPGLSDNCSSHSWGVPSLATASIGQASRDALVPSPAIAVCALTHNVHHARGDAPYEKEPRLGGHGTLLRGVFRVEVYPRDRLIVDAPHHSCNSRYSELGTSINDHCSLCCGWSFRGFGRSCRENGKLRLLGLELSDVSRNDRVGSSQRGEPAR